MNIPLSKPQFFSLLILLGLSFTVEGANNQLSAHCKGVPCPTPLQPPTHFPPRSCLDLLKRGVKECGYYKIYDNSGKAFPVYCDMKTEPGNAWTLVLSWSHKYHGLGQFKSSVFKVNAPVNENAPNWNLYRQTLDRMQSIKSHSTHWRSTCSYPIHGVDYTDYVRGSFKDFDVMNFIGDGVCNKVEYVNIRGHAGVHTTAQWWQKLNAYFLHINSPSQGCGFKPSAGAVASEDNFGYHGSPNPKFRCTESDGSTTQWWFGGHI